MEIAFISAVYNEIKEIDDLINHVSPYVDKICIVDDGSTDGTWEYLQEAWITSQKMGIYQIPHSGLPETVKDEALGLVEDETEWVLMLDADERFITPISEIVEWTKAPSAKEVDYVYFDQYEIIDGEHVRTFQKCKLFRKGAIKFPLNDIHKDDELIGQGAYFGWKVAHRKGSYKQIQRELEYLRTYDKLFEEGHIDEGRRNWLRNLHHYVKEPHG